MTDNAFATIGGSGFADVTDGETAAVALEKMTCLVTGACARVEAGSVIDLDGLDGAIATLCARITALAPEARQSCRRPMIALVDEFDRLARCMRNQLDQVGGQLRGLTDQRRAAAAYAKPKPPSTSGGTPAP